VTWGVEVRGAVRSMDKPAADEIVVARVELVVVRTGEWVEKWKKGKRQSHLDCYLDCSAAAAVLIERVEDVEG
jgi:hypothetical protein